MVFSLLFICSICSIHSKLVCIAGPLNAINVSKTRINVTYKRRLRQYFIIFSLLLFPVFGWIIPIIPWKFAGVKAMTVTYIMTQSQEECRGTEKGLEQPQRAKWPNTYRQTLPSQCCKVQQRGGGQEESERMQPRCFHLKKICQLFMF